MKIPHILALLIILTGCNSHQSSIFVLSASENGLSKGPVIIDLPKDLNLTGPLILTDLALKQEYPLQQLNDDQYVFMLDSSFVPGETRNYRIMEDPALNREFSVKLKNDDGQIDIAVNNQPVLTYHTEIVLPPKGLPEYYKRSGFIHPIYSPSGKVITDGFPDEHAHQHGIFLAWVNTLFQGEKVDFWNQQDKTGTVMHMEVNEIIEGPVFSSFKVHLSHLAFPKGDTMRVLEEKWHLRVYNSENPFIVDLESVQLAKGPDTLKVLPYHYGGLGIRGSEEWNDLDFEQDENDPTANFIGKKGKGGFLTSEGKTRIDGNHTKPEWTDFYGTIDGQEAGIVVMGHPDNFRYPQSIRIHPVMPYFCITPTVDGGFSLAPDEPFLSKYRIITHDRSPDPATVDGWFNTYKHPAVSSNDTDSPNKS